MKNLTNKLKTLVSVISTRGVGHTSLMKTGTATYDKPFIQVGFTMSAMKASGLDQNPNAKLMTIDRLSQEPTSSSMPVAIDNHVIRELLSDILITVECMESSIDKKNRVMEELMNIVEYYQDRAHKIERIGLELALTPWWKINRLIRLEKEIHQAILEYNTDSNPVEASFQRVLKIANENQYDKTTQTESGEAGGEHTKF